MVESQIEAEVELYQGRYVTETPPFSNQQMDDDDEVDHYRDADANGLKCRQSLDQSVQLQMRLVRLLGSRVRMI